MAAAGWAYFTMCWKIEWSDNEVLLISTGDLFSDKQWTKAPAKLCKLCARHWRRVSNVVPGRSPVPTDSRILVLLFGVLTRFRVFRNIKNKPALGALQSVRKTNDGQFLACACFFFSLVSLHSRIACHSLDFSLAARKCLLFAIHKAGGFRCWASVKLLVYATLPLDRPEGRTGALEAYIPERQVGNLRT